jgi:sugar phosphate isomerase/epimerase
MLEFSSGIPYRPDLKEIYLKADIPRLPHNYFPPPAEPFVLNLASQDPEIRRRSISHCIQGLELAKASESPFFAAHSGFCGDPRPEELGRPIQFDPSFRREAYWKHFLNSLQEVLDFAGQLKVDFLIENNVCAPFNLVNGNLNPFLCADPEEIKLLFKQLQHPRLGLLLDTGHWKVSGNSLGFDPARELPTIHPFIRGIHHNDNNGHEDSNDKLTSGYWFLPYLKNYRHLCQVIEVKNVDDEEISRMIGMMG